MIVIFDLNSSQPFRASVIQHEHSVKLTLTCKQGAGKPFDFNQFNLLALMVSLVTFAF